MRALVTTGSRPVVEVRETAEPQPHGGEALVEVRATSVNRGEARPLADQPAGTVPGWDVAGVVLERAADGSGPRAGARVVGLTSAGGAWAERAAVPANVLAELPDEVSFDDAATLPIAAVTAWQGLRLAGPLLGKRVCITGAAGGVGRFAIQLASLGGADVTAVARSAERSSGLAALGAREVVEALEPEGDAFDVILDSVGGAVLAAAIGRIAPGGDIVSVGNSSGEETTFDVRTLFRRAHGARLHGYLSHTALAEDHSGARDLRALADLVAAGRLRTEVSMAVDWHEADAAITALLQRRVNGKAVLRIASGA